MRRFRFSCITCLLSSYSLSASVIYLSELDSYSPNQNLHLLSPRISKDSGGTSYVFSNSVEISHALFPLDKTANCFTNTEGNLAFIGNQHALIFDHVQSNAIGATISHQALGHSVTLSGFSMVSFIQAPSSTTSGTGQGALYSLGPVLIQNNHNLLFCNNTSTGNGGAIYCPFLLGSKEAVPSVSFSGNEILTFSHNSTSQGNGGAIYAHHLTISSGLSTLFKNNHAHSDTHPGGGAIAIAAGGTLALSADYGNIIFEGNTVSSQPNKRMRNAIHLHHGARITQLRATEGNHISFYDPLIQIGNPTEELVLNAPEGSHKYRGTLRFSGAQFSNKEKTLEDLTSIFTQDVRLASGTLSLEDDAVVNMRSFTQEQDSCVRMDKNTILQCDKDISLANLCLHLTSTPPQQAASIISQGGRLSLQNPIMLSTPHHSFYEHPDLQHSFTVDILELKAKESENIQVSKIEALPIGKPESHYGYQGNWNIQWKDTQDPKGEAAIKKASITWEPTGYVLHPERKGTLVPTSAWDVAMDMRAVFSLIESSVENPFSSLGVWSSGIVNYFEHNDGDKENHRYESLGGVLGLNCRLFSSHLLGISGGQIFGKSQDFSVSQNLSVTQFGSVYAQVTDEATLATLCSAKVSFSRTSHTLKTHYTFTDSQESPWLSTCWSGEFATGVPITGGHPRSPCRITPFIKLQGVFYDQQAFEESGEEARSFDDMRLMSLWIPTGIKFERHGYKARNSMNFSLAYVPNVFRKHSHGEISLLSNGISWKAEMLDLEPQAVLVQFTNHYVLFHRVELFGNATCELGHNAQKYHGSVSMKILF